MKIQMPNYINKLFKIVKDKYPDCELYIVGGCVRDSLLNIIPHDYDVTTNLLPKQIISCFEKKDIFNNNGLKHGTVSVLIDNNPVEITTYRTEGMYVDGRRPSDVSFNATLEEDLKRRDFTINALAYNEKDGLVDLFGGVDDINNKIIKAVGNPHDRLSEDYLRVLRALRFASRFDYEIDSPTKEAINQTYQKLSLISKERIKIELEGILKGQGVYKILAEYKNVFKSIIPDLEKCDGFMQNNSYHIHQDLYEHTINVVKNTKPDFITRMAALLHDIGKVDCYSESKKDGKIQGHFYNHATLSCEKTKKILNDLKFSNKEIKEILFLIQNHDASFNSKKSIKKLLIKLPNQDFDLFLKLIDLRLADQNDHQNISNELINLEEIIKIAKEIMENEAISIKDLNISGDDLINLGIKGKLVGDILKILFDKVLKEEILNEHETLLNKAKKILNNK